MDRERPRPQASASRLESQRFRAWPDRLGHENWIGNIGGDADESVTQYQIRLGRCATTTRSPSRLKRCEAIDPIAQLHSEDDRPQSRQCVRRSISIQRRPSAPHGQFDHKGPLIPEERYRDRSEDRFKCPIRGNHFRGRQLRAKRFVFAGRRSRWIHFVVFISRVHTGFGAWGQTLALGRLDAGVLNSGVARSVRAPNTHRREHRLPEAEGHETQECDQALDRWWVHGRTEECIRVARPKVHWVNIGRFWTSAEYPKRGLNRQPGCIADKSFGIWRSTRRTAGGREPRAAETTIRALRPFTTPTRVRRFTIMPA